MSSQRYSELKELVKARQELKELNAELLVLLKEAITGCGLDTVRKAEATIAKAEKLK